MMIVKNTINSHAIPMILNRFIAALGHFEHTVSLILSYLIGPVITHSLHRIPLYPSMHWTG
jgi:hypothetical protein